MIRFPDLPEEEAEAGIQFFSENTVFALPDEQGSADWIREVVAQAGFDAGAISFIFCSDGHLHAMNVEYLEHDTLTDVITFPYGEEPLSGDIFISVDRVAENAEGLGVPMLQELHRVMVHGVLHLMGHDDATPEAKAAMRALEDEALATLPPSLEQEPGS